MLLQRRETQVMIVHAGKVIFEKERSDEFSIYTSKSAIVTVVEGRPDNEAIFKDGS